jgi:hypothetical protein
MKPLPSALFQHWIHSHEEDFATVVVYRPRSYPLPPARGRDGFIIFTDGLFRQLDIAMTDGNRTVEGKWEQIADTMLKVEFPLAHRSPMVYEVLECEVDRLEIRQPIGQK